MEVFNLKNYLAERKLLVDRALKELLPPPSGLQKTVMEAAYYSLFAGGKRLRPILCMAAAEAVGGSPEMVLPAACALEMIHTYSLIHDDLPAMDDDDFRRGKPTNHKVFGEAIAILAGDTLLTEAFGIIAKMGIDGTGAISPRTVLHVIQVLVEAAGYRGMIGGQVIDLEAEKRDVDLATVEYMHASKTAALITASLEIGALLSSSNKIEIESLKRYGYHLGLAFQITDDLLDIEGDAEQMGKRPGSDIARNKKTYPALVGIEKAKEAARSHVREALSALEPFKERAVPLKAIAEYLLIRRG